MQWNEHKLDMGKDGQQNNESGVKKAIIFQN